MEKKINELQEAQEKALKAEIEEINKKLAIFLSSTDQKN